MHNRSPGGGQIANERRPPRVGATACGPDDRRVIVTWGPVSPAGAHRLIGKPVVTLGETVYPRDEYCIPRPQPLYDVVEYAIVMTDGEPDDIEAIRERKRQQIMEQATGAQQSGDGRRTAPDSPIHLDGADHFEEVVGSYGVVLVDYYADWCGPCKMLEPIVEQIARTTPAAVAKVDIDRHQDLARRANVRGVPTLQLFADGTQQERLVGVQDQGTLTGLVERYA